MRTCAKIGLPPVIITFLLAQHGDQAEGSQEIRDQREQDMASPPAPPARLTRSRRQRRNCCSVAATPTSWRAGMGSEAMDRVQGWMERTGMRAVDADVQRMRG